MLPGGGDGVHVMSSRSHHKACVQAKQNREDGIAVWCSDKTLHGFTAKGYLDCMLRVRAFWIFTGCLYLDGLLRQLSLLKAVISFDEGPLSYLSERFIRI